MLFLNKNKYPSESYLQKQMKHFSRMANKKCPLKSYFLLIKPTTSQKYSPRICKRSCVAGIYNFKDL